MRKSGKAKQLGWDSHWEWPSLPIYNLISDYAYGNEEADFQRPTQGWARFSISSKSTVFEMQPTDQDDKSLSHKPGLLFEQVSQLMIISLMFDITRDYYSTCCSASILWYRCFHAHTDTDYGSPLRPAERWASIQLTSCMVKWPVHSIAYTSEQF